MQLVQVAHVPGGRGVFVEARVEGACIDKEDLVFEQDDFMLHVTVTTKVGRTFTPSWQSCSLYAYGVEQTLKH